MKWVITSPQEWAKKEGGTKLPFFCGDVTDRSLRVGHSLGTHVCILVRPSIIRLSLGSNGNDQYHTSKHSAERSIPPSAVSCGFLQNIVSRTHSHSRLASGHDHTLRSYLAAAPPVKVVRRVHFRPSTHSHGCEGRGRGRAGVCEDTWAWIVRGCISGGRWESEGN